jgi:lysophospholipase L1-like esterase
LNESLRSLCETSGNYIYIDGFGQLVGDAGKLKTEYHIGDGVHLSAQGYQVLINTIKEAVF